MDSNENLSKSLKQREMCGDLLTKLAVVSGVLIQNLALTYHVGGSCDALTKQRLEEMHEAIGEYLSIISE